LDEVSFSFRAIVEAKKNLSGVVLYSPSPIAFLQGVDPERGYVSDKKSEIYGKEFRGKILVFPNAVGSSVGAYVIYRMRKNGKAPIAMVNKVSDIITASGCALAGIPLYDVQARPFELLKNIRKIAIDGRTGKITSL
jgi:uncharacterized protein